MIKKSLFFMAMLLFPFLLSSQNEVLKGSMVWFDEFEGTGSPNAEKWEQQEYNRKNNNNGPDGWWSREDVYLDGKGNLVIRVRKINNRNNDDDPYDYSVGAIRTKNKFEKRYGVFEIRCKLPTQQGWWVAFWMMQGNVNSELNGGVDGSEVDIMEGFGWTDRINQAIHWDGYGDAHQSIGHKTVEEGIREGFHTYTMQWTPGEYVFYIDGKETWRTQGGGVCNEPGYLKVTGEVSTVENVANKYWAEDPSKAEYPDSFIVDYVKVYDLPAEEVSPIRELVENCYPEGNLAVGSACHEHYLGTQTEEILNREFGYVTPANDFKQSYVHPEPGVWRWEKSDRWVNHCREHSQFIRLHAPISPQCSPWTKNKIRTPEELEQNLTEYMTAICKRYNDSTHVKWLDVVNETVFHTDGRWFGPDDGSDTWNNPWPRIGFDETHELRPPLYIKKAFEIANEHGSNFKLIINQHGGMEPFIWDKIKKLVAYLRENNLRVDGIGWQAHIWLGWEKEAGNMERLSELIDWCHANDLEFHITEFNVWLKPEDMDRLTEQAETFYAITQLAAEKQTTGFVGINFWHIRGVETQNKDRDGGPWAEDYQPKEAYYKIKEALCEASPNCRGECGPERLYLEVDTFGTGSLQNLLKGEWQTHSDDNSSGSLDLNHPDGFEGSVSAKFDWMPGKGAALYPYSFVQTWLDEQKESVDLTDYYAVSFQARGNGTVKVGLTTVGQGEEDYFYSTIQLKEEWQNFQLPFFLFSQDKGEEAIDPGNVTSLLFSGKGDFNVPGEMWIDNIRFINKYSMSPVEPLKPPEPQVFHKSKINQVGYLPESFKEFSVTADSLTAGQPFVVVDKNDNEVYSGMLPDDPLDDSDISGENVFRVNFSEVTTPGEYRIKVGNSTSFPYIIQESVYDSLLWQTIRSFYLFRSNFALDDPHTGLNHPKGHPDDAFVEDGEGEMIDLAGGWYNAAGFGKYVPTTAFASAHLMNLYEINPVYFEIQNLQLSESENNLPDILNEVKTGLDWLLKMQRSDGAVYHKLDSEIDLAYGYGPDEDPFERALDDPQNLTTIDAADFTAVIARAARLFAPFDSVFAQTCRDAAVLSWEWVQAHPAIGQDDVFYTDPQVWQEMMWAKAEMYMLTEDKTILGDFYADLSTRLLTEPAWNQPQLLSFVNLCEFPEIPDIVKNRIKVRVENYAAELKTVVDQSGYGSALGKFDWEEGSNIKLANRGAVFAYAHYISGNDEWLRYVSQQLDYLLGRNSLDFSFVTGWGENRCSQPFHWINKTYGIVPGGLLVQGAAGGQMITLPDIDEALKVRMKAGYPPAKIYLDTISSAVSNEVSICSQASLAYLAGYLALHEREVNVTVSPQFRQKKNSQLVITAEGYSLFCSGCNGKTIVEIYSTTGKILTKMNINAGNPKVKLVYYKELLRNYPFILYRVTDECGQSVNGKIFSGM